VNDPIDNNGGRLATAGPSAGGGREGEGLGRLHHCIDRGPLGLWREEADGSNDVLFDVNYS